jgi:hypothetical protein
VRFRVGAISAKGKAANGLLAAKSWPFTEDLHGRCQQ